MEALAIRLEQAAIVDRHEVVPTASLPMASPPPSGSPRPVDAHLLSHGAVGNGQIIALVAPSTSVEWLCMPRFDSPSVFGALLDREKGGSWSFRPPGAETAASFNAEYITNTNVMRTVIEDGPNVAEVFDFAPCVAEGTYELRPVEFVRVVRRVSGQPRLGVHFDPRPNYARGSVSVVHTGSHSLRVNNDGESCSLYLRSNVPATSILNRTSMLVEDWYFVLSYGKESSIRSAADAECALNDTVRYWRTWCKTCALPSFAAELVLRSALCLKLHIYADTGAIIAATTTSVPEAIGTERTWDYRFCWMRDSAFVVEALRRLGHLAEGEAFVRFLHNTASDRLQPVYGLGGEIDCKEQLLEHLSGFENTKPVRIGNQAAEQTQHDVPGELLLCLESIIMEVRVVHDDDGAKYWGLIKQLVVTSMKAFNELDTGIWEFRTLPRHYTFSKALCWVGVQRGARLAAHLGHPEAAKEWNAWVADHHAQLLDRAFNKRLGMFVQAFDGDHADASNLLLPILGVVEAKDPRFVATVRAYERRLVKNGLMTRYQNEDDFGDTTSAFMICSFWWAEALALMVSAVPMRASVCACTALARSLLAPRTAIADPLKRHQGEVDSAVAVFERVVSYANDLGLLAEDVEPSTGRLLGNFPQAYTHVGVINAAITIGRAKDAQALAYSAWKAPVARVSSTSMQRRRLLVPGAGADMVAVSAPGTPRQ